MSSYLGLWLFVAVGIQTVAVSIGCGGSITVTDHGYITSPNYPRDYPHGNDCSWYLTAPAGSVIHLVFLDFDVEHHGSCNYDFVNIYNGPSSSSPLVARKCGRTLPYPISYRSSSNKMYVRFCTDGSVSAKGFKAMYFVTLPSCGGVLTGRRSGSLMSPFYPRLYGHRMKCGWMLITPGGCVALNFFDFDIENHSSCGFDYVAVYNGYSLTQLGKYCGKTKPSKVTSSSRFMFVRMSTDGSVNGKGFRASYYQD